MSVRNLTFRSMFFLIGAIVILISGCASAEFEATDSQSGEVVAAAIEEQKGERGFDGLTK